MGEKREGFGLPVGQEATGGAAPKTVFTTPHYRVVVAMLTNGPEHEPEELRIRYVVLSREEPVIAAHTGVKGEAVAIALAAEESLQRAAQAAEEQAARNYKPVDNPASGYGGSGLGFNGGAPNLG